MQGRVQEGAFKDRPCNGHIEVSKTNCELYFENDGLGSFKNNGPIITGRGLRLKEQGETFAGSAKLLLEELGSPAYFP